MSEKRQPLTALTEVRAVFNRVAGGTHVYRTAHHTGCALDLGKGECNCDPIRVSDFHTPRTS